MNQKGTKQTSSTEENLWRLAVLNLVKKALFTACPCLTFCKQNYVILSQLYLRYVGGNIYIFKAQLKLVSF